jgi:protein tyrosine phosphatase (PTP) superfamily phosphohydrolase (DUF442 family)
METRAMQTFPESPGDAPEASSGIRRRPQRRIAVLAALPFAAVLFLARVYGPLGNNLHEVVAGEAYRSAQLSASDLERTIRVEGLKTVVSLRGGSPLQEWYREERDVCDRLGVRHDVIHMSAERLPHPEEMRRLVTSLDTAERPLLFHCERGADRAGLVAALYLHLYHGVPLDEAERRELSWRYGHLSFGGTSAMDAFLALYRHTAAGLDLRSWILGRYPVVYGARARRQVAMRGNSLRLVWLSSRHLGATPNAR